MEDYDSKSLLHLEYFPSFNSDQLFSSSSSSPQRKIILKEISMVVIRDCPPPDDEFSVFPPSNHENLIPPSIKEQGNSPSTSFRSSSSSSFSSFSFSDDDTCSYSSSQMPSNHQVEKSRQISRVMGFGVQILRTRITAIASTMSSKIVRTMAFWLFSPAARIVLVLTFWWLYKRARRRRLRRSTDRLRMIIKEKDEKINQLLRQIVEMNGVLIAQQKGLLSK